ncbi:MAG: hypothetical protein GY930_05655 [bacterium]|nr:hypothetical protein [bacterium]
MIAEPCADKRLSLSLEALMELTGSPGVSQWLELSQGHFQCMRERGVVDENVTTDGIELVADGVWDPRLAQGLVLVTRDAPNRMAWVLSTPIAREEALDSAEAYLFLVGVLHPPSYEIQYPSLLPQPEEPDDL